MIATYTYAPRPTGGPVSFKLMGNRLTVDSGRKVQEVELGAVDQVRMTFEPGRLAQKAFRTRLHMQDGRSFAFSSLNWKSFIEAERLDAEYRSFAGAVIHAVAAANPNARFVAGRPRWLWTTTAAVSAVSLLAMALFVWRAVTAGYTSTALMGAVFIALGVWQLEPMIRLNKPRRFQPEAPPRDLLP
jgi:hypothetical protein